MPAEVRLYDRLFAVPFPGRAQSVRARAATMPRRTAAVAHATVVAGDDDDDEAAEPVERN